MKSYNISHRKEVIKVTSKEVEKVLKRNGFKMVRQTGSHRIFLKDDKTVVVPCHGNKDVPIGTLKSIERQSGINFKK